MADVTIRFRAQFQQARRETYQLRSEIDRLKEDFNKAEKAADDAAQDIDKFGDEAAQAVVGVTNLGRQVFKTSQEAKQFGGVFQDARGKIREANGQFSKTKETVRDLSGGLKNSRTNSSLLIGTLDDLKGSFGALGIVAVTQQLTNFARGSADAAIKVDAHTRALTALTGSASLAQRELQAIQDLADEPGVTFEQAIKGTVSLRAIDVDPETTNRIIRELGNVAAFSGGAGEFERGLLGLRQIIQRGRLSQEELNQLTENLGLASKAIKNFYGTVLAEDIQAHLDNNEQGVEDFVETVLTELEKLDRFPYEAASVKVKNLSNSYFEFQAVLGEKFLPIIAGGAEGLTDFLDTLTDYIENTDLAEESTDAFRESLEASNTEADKRKAIQNRIEDLKGLITELETAGDASANFLSFRGEETEAGEDLREYREELTLLQGVLDGTTSSTEDLVAEEVRLKTELAAVRDELSDVNVEISKADPRALAREKSGLRDEAQKLKDEEAALAEQLSIVKEALETILIPVKDFEEKTRDLVTASGAYKDTLGELPPAITAVNETLAPLLVTAGEVEAIFSDLDTALYDTDVEMQALSGTVESADEILQDSTGLVREWNKEWENSKVAVLSFKEALDGVALPDIPDVTAPDLTLPGVQSPIDAIIEDMNSVQGAADDLEKEVTDAGQSFDDLREAVTAAEPSLDTLESKFDAIEDSVDDLPGGVSDFQDSLQLLSQNAPGLLSGLTTLLSDIDSRFAGISRTASAILSGDPVGFLSSIPGLQQSVQDLLTSAGDESEASGNQRAALSIRDKILAAPITESAQEILLEPLDNYIRENVINYIRSLPRALEASTVAQQQASLERRGFDFDYVRDAAALTASGNAPINFGELFRAPQSANLSGIVGLFNHYLESEGTKALEQLADVRSPEAPVVAPVPPAPVVVQGQENLDLAAFDAAVTLFNDSVGALDRAAAAHTAAAGAIVAAANRLGAQGGGGGGDFELTEEAILAIGNNLVAQQADGRFVGLPKED